MLQMGVFRLIIVVAAEVTVQRRWRVVCELVELQRWSWVLTRSTDRSCTAQEVDEHHGVVVLLIAGGVKDRQRAA
jgi:hypothetical protein